MGKDELLGRLGKVNHADFNRAVVERLKQLPEDSPAYKILSQELDTIAYRLEERHRRIRDLPIGGRGLR